MALPATEAFTAANNTNLTTFPNWTVVAGAFDIQSNALSSNQSGALCLARWNADTPDADQYTTATLVQTGGSGGCGCAVRVGASGVNGYGARVYEDGSDEFFKVVSGTETGLGSTNFGWGAGDVMRLEAEGTTIRWLRDGVELDSIPGESSLSSGLLGVCGAGNGSVGRIDDWEGGNLGGASGGATVAPEAGALALAGQTPSVGRSGSAAPGAGTLALAAAAPTAMASDHQAVAAGAAGLSLTALAPTVAVSAHQVSQPGGAALALAGEAPIPSATAHQWVAPGLAGLTLAGLAPDAFASSGTSPRPGTASLTLTAQTPSADATANVWARPGAASLTLTGFRMRIAELIGDSVRSFASRLRRWRRR